MNQKNTPWTRDCSGSSIIETALMLPVLLLIMVAAIDFGGAYYLAIEASSAAEAGALYGIQNVSDTAGMVAAAKLDGRDVTPSATYGCECSDGTSVVVSCGTAPTCTLNVVNYVEVTTLATYTSLVNYPGLPPSFVMAGKSHMRAGH